MNNQSSEIQQLKLVVSEKMETSDRFFNDLGFEEEDLAYNIHRLKLNKDEEVLRI